MGNAITQDNRALWLMMARSGGWWTVRDLVHHWHPTFPEWELQQLLDALLAAGLIAGRDMRTGAPSYCVTSDCTPLPGYTLDGREVPEAA